MKFIGEKCYTKKSWSGWDVPLQCQERLQELVSLLGLPPPEYLPTLAELAESCDRHASRGKYFTTICRCNDALCWFCSRSRGTSAPIDVSPCEPIYTPVPHNGRYLNWDEFQLLRTEQSVSVDLFRPSRIIAEEAKRIAGRFNDANTEYLRLSIPHIPWPIIEVKLRSSCGKL